MPPWPRHTRSIEGLRDRLTVAIFPRMKALALGLATALLALPALAAPAQFDLVCTGTSQSPGAETTTPWAETIRVDLAAGAYCEPDCLGADPIARIEPGTIYFRDAQEAHQLVGLARVFAVSRSTGKLIKGYDGGDDIKANCRLAPFTPMPPNEF